jgi:hypothetical protein
MFIFGLRPLYPLKKEAPVTTELEAGGKGLKPNLGMVAKERNPAAAAGN